MVLVTSQVTLLEWLPRLFPDLYLVYSMLPFLQEFFLKVGSMLRLHPFLNLVLKAKCETTGQTLFYLL